MNEPLLHIKDLNASYGKIKVLWDVNLEINLGEIVALIGSNGAGKTTLLRTLSFMMPSVGTIQFGGRLLQNLTPEQVFSLGIVQVPEGRQLFHLMTTEENLLMGAYCQTDRAIIALNLEKVYHRFPVLKNRRHQQAGSLSGGEQQMCAIARAMMAMPKLLMVDEMSLGLAPLVIDMLFDAMTEFRKDGVTLLIVEQDVYSVLQYADRGYVLENGKIVRSGGASELLSDPNIQRAYFGI